MKKLMVAVVLVLCCSGTNVFGDVIYVPPDPRYQGVGRDIMQDLSQGAIMGQMMKQNQAPSVDELRLQIQRESDRFDRQREMEDQIEAERLYRLRRENRLQELEDKIDRILGE